MNYPSHLYLILQWSYVPLRSWLLQLAHSLLASITLKQAMMPSSILHPLPATTRFLCSSSKQNLSPNFTTFAISIYDLSWTHSNQTFIPTTSPLSLRYLTISMSLNPVALSQSSLDSTTPFSSWWHPPWDSFSSWLPGHLLVSDPFHQHFSPTSLARSIPSSQSVTPGASG